MSDDNNFFKLRFWREITSAKGVGLSPLPTGFAQARNLATRNKIKVINLPDSNIAIAINTSINIILTPDERAFQQFIAKMKKFINQIDENDEILKQLNIYSMNVFNQSECPICFDEFTKESLPHSIILPCNHLICMSCIQKMDLAKCPLCRIEYN